MVVCVPGLLVHKGLINFKVNAIPPLGDSQRDLPSLASRSTGWPPPSFLRHHPSCYFEARFLTGLELTELARLAWTVSCRDPLSLSLQHWAYKHIRPAACVGSRGLTHVFVLTRLFL